MVLLFYVYDCLMFSTSEDKIDDIYASLQADLNIEDDRKLDKYLGIDLDHRPYGSIHIRQPYLTQGIVYMIPGMYKSSANPTPVVNTPLEKNRKIMQETITLITDQ